MSHGDARGYIWRAGEDAPRALVPTRLSFPAPDARQQTVSLEQGDLKLQLKPAQRLFRHAPMEEQGWLGRLVGSWVGNPVTTTYRATVAGNGLCPNLQGIMEITHVEP